MGGIICNLFEEQETMCYCLV